MDLIQVRPLVHDSALKETRPYARLEAARGPSAPASSRPSLGHVFFATSIGNVSLFAACQAGLVNNLNDGMSWGIFCHTLPQAVSNRSRRPSPRIQEAT